MIRRTSAAAAGWSLIIIVLGVWWSLDPSRYPLQRATLDGASLITGISPDVAAPVLLALGVAGLAGAAALRYASAGPLRTVVFGLAVGYAVIFGLILPDAQVVILAAFLTALLALPVLLAVLLVGAVRTGRRAALTFGVVAVLIAATWRLGVFTPASIGGVAANIASVAAERLIRPAVLLFFLFGALVWGAAAVALFRAGRGRCGSCGRPGGAWTSPEAAARWGRWVTIGAAICPLPYGLQRLSWLTPWPIAATAEGFAADPGIRLYGLMLGGAALAGSVLTLGLIRPWGEVWPRWIPWLRGRRVPPAAAIIPGAALAAIFTVTGVSWTLMSAHAGAWLLMLVLPFPVWGPLLGAATYAYYLRRRGTCRACGNGHLPGLRRPGAGAGRPRRP